MIQQQLANLAKKLHQFTKRNQCTGIKQEHTAFLAVDFAVVLSPSATSDYSQTNTSTLVQYLSSSSFSFRTTRVPFAGKTLWCWVRHIEQPQTANFVTVDRHICKETQNSKLICWLPVPLRTV